MKVLLKLLQNVSWESCDSSMLLKIMPAGREQEGCREAGFSQSRDKCPQERAGGCPVRGAGYKL